MKAPGVASKGDGINRPGIIFTNALDDLTELYENAHLSDDGEVAVIDTEYRASFKIASLDRVSDFPFDRYESCLSFLLMPTNLYSAGVDKAEVSFSFEGVKNKEGVLTRLEPRIFDVSSVSNEWAVFNPDVTAFNEWGSPQMQFSFELRRRFDAVSVCSL